MLFYLGKDVLRWLDQCFEWAQHVPELQEADLPRQSFAAMLTADPPAAVKEKLIRWGVSDYVSIFSRAIGLNALFSEPPVFTALSEEFLRNYHRYADCLFQLLPRFAATTDARQRQFPVRSLRLQRVLTAARSGMGNGV